MIKILLNQLQIFMASPVASAIWRIVHFFSFREREEMNHTSSVVILLCKYHESLRSL